MPQKRAVLSALSRPDLQNLADSFELEVTDRRVHADLVDALGRSHRATLPRLLEELPRASLKAVCRSLGCADTGREKHILIERLLGLNGSADTVDAPPPADRGRRPRQRSVLATLRHDRLATLVDAFDINGIDRRSRDEMIEALAHSHKATLPAVLEHLSRDELKDVCQAHQLADSGREKAGLIARILGSSAPQNGPTASGRTQEPPPASSPQLPSKRLMLEALTRAELQDIATTFEVEVHDRRQRAELIDGLAWARRVQLPHVLGALSREGLKRVCRHVGMDDGGREKTTLISRLLGDASGGGDSASPPPVAERARHAAALAGATDAGSSRQRAPRAETRGFGGRAQPTPIGLAPEARSPQSNEMGDAFMPTAVPTATSVRAFYAACLRGLRVVEQRQPTGRRYGPEADALWKTFAGHLSTAARIDLLLRDMAASYGTAFAATHVFFHMPPASEDEPFGAYWPALDAVEAEELWRSTPPMNGSTPLETLRACAEPWELALEPVKVGTVEAQSRVVAVGPSAVASLANAFVGSRDLDWAEQVLCVATRPAHRHIAGLAAAVINAPKPTTLLGRSAEPLATPPRRIDRVVAGPDADPDDVAWSQEQFRVA